MSKKKKREPQYKLREGFRLPVAPQVVGERIAGLMARNGGFVKPADVVEDARPEDSPLHPCIEPWDPQQAAQLYWEDKARYTIRAISVVYDSDPGEEPEPPRIAHVCVELPDGDGRAYISSFRAMADADLRGQVISEAEGLLRGVANRYRGIPGLKDLLGEAIERLGLDG